MYKVLYEGYTLHSPSAGAWEFNTTIRDPDVHLAVGEAGRMAFTIDNDHVSASQLAKLRGVVDLQDDGLSLFKGRIIKDTRNFDKSRRIEVEGLLACLNDSVIPPFRFPEDWENDAAYKKAAASGNVVAFFLGWLLEQHNNQVGPAQRIELGTVTVGDPNNYITRSASEYATTMATVRGKLEDPLGGYLLADYSGTTTKLHSYAQLPMTNVQRVKFGDNLLDLEDDLDAKETFTAILPVGKEGLTILNLPDGEIPPGYIKEGQIIYSTAAEEELGGVRVTRVEKWNDVTEATNLQSKALARLSGGGPKLTQTITVKAADVSFLPDSGTTPFRVGQNVQIESAPHGFGEVYPLMELEPDLLDPANTTIVLGATVKTSVDISRDQLQQSKDYTDQKTDVLTGQVDGVKTSVTTQITEAIQSSESIIFQALENYLETSNFEEYQRTVTSQLELVAEEIALRFTEVSDRTTEVDGDLQRVVETLEKHFEFSLDDGLTIRAGANTMTLSLDNDLIIFTKDGQQFGWWDGIDFHTGNIVVDVNERAQFGNFAFVPRSNGSLSFLKVGG